MKANEAPEKIYFEVNNNLIGLYDSAILKMFSVKKDETVIEYTRTDAFTEKAVDWLEKKGCCYRWDDSGSPNWDMIDAFIKYMEGE